MIIAAGIECNVDPLLFNTIKAHCGKIELDSTLLLHLSLSLFPSPLYIEV